MPYVFGNSRTARPRSRTGARRRWRSTLRTWVWSTGVNVPQPLGPWGRAGSGGCSGGSPDQIRHLGDGDLRWVKVRAAAMRGPLKARTHRGRELPRPPAGRRRYAKRSSGGHPGLGMLVVTGQRPGPKCPPEERRVARAVGCGHRGRAAVPIGNGGMYGPHRAWGTVPDLRFAPRYPYAGDRNTSVRRAMVCVRCSHPPEVSIGAECTPVEARSPPLLEADWIECPGGDELVCPGRAIAPAPGYPSAVLRAHFVVSQCRRLAVAAASLLR